MTGEDYSKRGAEYLDNKNFDEAIAAFSEQIRLL